MTVAQGGGWLPLMVGCVSSDILREVLLLWCVREINGFKLGGKDLRAF